MPDDCGTRRDGLETRPVRACVRLRGVEVVDALSGEDEQADKQAVQPVQCLWS